jgi:NAD(P)-dependent dehydrogenase (short-subunit alcohol dehydrogenase family)
LGKLCMATYGQLSPAEATRRLRENDPTFLQCDLSSNAVLQAKGSSLIPALCEALAQNTCCRELILMGCGIDDITCNPLATALRSNTTLTLLNLEDNRINNAGAQALARALEANTALVELNLLKQKGRFGDATLEAYLSMFEVNITLLKIVWRLDSRQSFQLTKKLTRNQEIARRRQQGLDYSHLLPARASDGAETKGMAPQPVAAAPTALSIPSPIQTEDPPPPPTPGSPPPPPSMREDDGIVRALPGVGTGALHPIFFF